MEKLCYIGLDYDTQLKSTAEVDKDKTYVFPDRNIITVGAKRFHCADQISPVHKSAESTTASWSVTLTSARTCSPMSGCQVARTFSKGMVSTGRANYELHMTIELTSNLYIGRYSCKPKTTSGLFHQEWWITQKNPYNSTIHLFRGLSTRSLLYCRSWTGNSTGGVHTRTEGRQTFPPQVYNLFRQQCQRSRSNYRYKEIEEGESSNSLTTWAKCDVLKLLVRNAETNFGRQSPSHHLCQSLRWKNALYKLSKKTEKKIIRKTTYASKGPDVTLRNTWGHKNSDVSRMPRETESNL